VADCDETRARAGGELGFGGGPAHAGCRAVDAQEDEGWCPAGWAGLPDVGVAIC
jgi:hypothetical protein